MSNKPAPTLRDLAKAMSDTSETDNLMLANAMIGSYLEDASQAIKEAMEVARQTGVPFKWEVPAGEANKDPVVLSFDPAEEAKDLEKEKEKADWNNSYCTEFESSWDDSGC